MIQTLQHSSDILDTLLFPSEQQSCQEEETFSEPHLDFAIREQLIRHLKHEISRNDFVSWFVSETWNTYEAASPVLLDLVGGIELVLAEFSHGDWTEGELRRFFRDFVKEHEMGSFRNPVRYAISSWGPGEPIQLSCLSPFAQKQPVVVYA